MLNPEGNTTQNQFKLKVGENVITDNTKVSNEFNNFFIESVKTLASGFPCKNNAAQTVLDIADEQDGSFQLKEVGQTAVLKAINDLNTTYSKDIYNLDL